MAGERIPNDVFLQRPKRGVAEILLQRAVEIHLILLLVATDRPSASAAKEATSTIPTVFTSGDDPVRLGLVKSLSHPGGNATGFHIFTTQLGPKRLGLVRDLLPGPGLIAFVVDSNNASSQQQVEEMRSAAKALGQPLLVFRAGTERELDEIFAAMEPPAGEDLHVAIRLVSRQGRRM